MRQAGRTVTALRRDERGLTLIELLVAATLGLIVVGGALTMFMGGVRSEPRTAAKVAALQQARVAVERITRELRQGEEVSTAGGAQLSILTYVKATTACDGTAASTSTLCRVTYSCSKGACTRTVAPPSGGTPGPATQVATGLADSDVFSYVYDPPEADEPSYVGVEFAFSTSGERPVTLEDGAALRNAGEEEPA